MDFGGSVLHFISLDSGSSPETLYLVSGNLSIWPSKEIRALSPTIEQVD